MQQTIIHISVCAVYLHKSSVKFTNLFLVSPILIKINAAAYTDVDSYEDDHEIAAEYH
jgi:hypothetical protein